jgi:hypothetical protein
LPEAEARKEAYPEAATRHSCQTEDHLRYTLILGINE